MSASSVPSALRGRVMWLAPAVAAMALALTPAVAAPDPGHQKGHGGPPGQAAVPRVPPGQVPGDGGSPGIPGPTPADADKAAKDAEKAANDQAKAVERAAKQADDAARHAVQETEKTAKDAEKAAQKAEKAAERQTDTAKKGAEHAAGPAQAAAAPAVPPANPADSATAAPLPASPPAPAATPAPAPAAETPARAPARRPTHRRAAHRRAARVRTRQTAAAAPRATPAPTPVAAALGAHRPARHAPATAKRPTRHHTTATPLTRSVVRVLEVIPPRLRLALALLAALGLALGAATAAQTVRARRLGRQRRLLAADVGLLQSALLPELPGRIGDVRVSAAYRPAEGLAAGGDFYDAFEVGGRTAIIVGDVAGHGRDVVPLTALVRYSIRAYLDAGLAPRTALQVAAAVLEPQLGERLVTVIVAVVDPAAGRLTYACAGHPPPLLKGEHPGWVTASSSPPIGAGVPTGRRQTTIGLSQGDIACFATDGLADARVERGRLGTPEVNQELTGLPPWGDAEQMLARVVGRTTSQPDDMAVCMVAPILGPAAVGTERLEELEVDLASLSDGRAERFLAACAVLPETAEEVVRQARGAIARTGSAVLSVRCDGGPGRVKVAPRPPVALPLAPVGVAA